MKPNRNPLPRRAGNAALGSHRPAALAGGGGDSTMDRERFYAEVFTPESLAFLRSRLAAIQRREQYATATGLAQYAAALYDLDPESEHLHALCEEVSDFDAALQEPAR